jgi:hypothetical protein
MKDAEANNPWLCRSAVYVFSEGSEKNQHVILTNLLKADEEGSQMMILFIPYFWHFAF